MMDTATINRTMPNWYDTRRLCYERSMRQRILIVEDDPDLREWMAQLLAGQGFDTEVASNGQAALDKALANPPRVIVLDMVMPVMDGWMFRAHQKYCVPIVHLHNVGAAAALQKPVHDDQLIAAIRALC